mmetsp:Transcript_10341/g.18229  ORF Transcript_10341/g.18229 Transcript_10341/m.18229 type:complete len:363 (-) Transcript_10341:1407-2495(-)
MSREEGCQVLSYTDGSHTRASTSVRDRKRFMKVEVANVSTNSTRARKTKLGIHVCAVHVNLSSLFVDHLTDGVDAALKLAVGGRIGDHEGCEAVPVLLHLCLKVFHIHVSIRVILDTDNLHATHYSGSGVGAVGRVRDKAHITVRLPAASVVVLNTKETSILAGCARVGLGGNCSKACERGQPCVKGADELFVPLGLVLGAKRVHVCKLWPSDGEQLRCSVQFHGTRTQRDHALTESDVTALQAGQVAQELGLRLVLREDSVLHKGRCTGLIERRAQVLCLSLKCCKCLCLAVIACAGCTCNCLDEYLSISAGGGLVNRDTNGGCVYATKVDTLLHSGSEHFVRIYVGYANGVEKVLVVNQG